jgi:hypothetical protein
MGVELSLFPETGICAGNSGEQVAEEDIGLMICAETGRSRR